jgi:hypothetical protein
MHQDFKELLSAFNAGRIRYLIVGGYAVSFHAQPRATKDLDILIGADAENSKAVYAALAKFGAPVKLLVRRGRIEIKVEVNFVTRGTVQPVRRASLTPTARDVLMADLNIPVVSLEDMYGGKLVAALAGYPQLSAKNSSYHTVQKFFARS